MRRGEIWEYALANPPGMVRVVVLSVDAYLEDQRATPTCADIVRRVPGVTSPLLVPMDDVDPTGGVVDVTSLRPCSRARMSGPIGMLTGATLARLTDAVRVYLDM